MLERGKKNKPGFNPITFTFTENSNYSLLEVIRQNIAGWCQQTFCFQRFVDNAQQCFAFTSRATFPAHNLNFRWKWLNPCYLYFVNQNYATLTGKQIFFIINALFVKISNLILHGLNLVPFQPRQCGCLRLISTMARFPNWRLFN